MHKNLIPVLAVIFCCGIRNAAFSQIDSSLFNMGRVNTKKEFTQSITVKGSDLERMPFAGLEDALKPWFFGNYSNANTLVFVVDGMIVPDINLYSVHDIEEVTLIQQAQVQLNGAAGQSQLVIVTLKHNRKGGSGIELNAQTFLVNRKFGEGAAFPGSASETNFYHRYSVSAFKNLHSIQFGATAEYLRDVYPGQKNAGSKIYTPNAMNRFRFGAWMLAQVSRKSSFSALVNYSPTQNNFGYRDDFQSFWFSEKGKINQRLPAVNFRLTTLLGPGLRNDLIAGYSSFYAKALVNLESFDSLMSPPEDQENNTQIFNRKEDILAGDRISWTKTSGDWQFETSLDFKYRHLKGTFEQNYVLTQTIPLQQGQTTSAGEQRSAYGGNLWLVTPALSLTYKNRIHLQAGIVENLGSKSSINHQRTYEFGSVSWKVWEASGDAGNGNLTLFGSASSAEDFTDPHYALQIIEPLPVSFTTGTVIPYPPDIKRSWIAEAGMQLNLLHQRIQFSYNFEQRNFPVEVLGTVNLPSGPPVQAWLLTSGKSLTHRLGINLAALEAKHVEWRTVLTVSAIKIETDTGNQNYPVTKAFGDFYGKGTSFTGGWINRVSWKNWFFGLDILYHFKHQEGINQGNVQQKNSLLLQNIFLGLKLEKAELYLASANAMQSSDLLLTNGNRYYGAGLKYSLGR